MTNMYTIVRSHDQFVGVTKASGFHRAIPQRPAEIHFRVADWEYQTFEENSITLPQLQPVTLSRITLLGGLEMVIEKQNDDLHTRNVDLLFLKL